MTAEFEGKVALVTGGAMGIGGAVSELSERRIVIGGAEALPADVFEDALAYVALGHLHKPQHVGGRAHVRYSGSPLPLSFAEVEYPHQVLRIDLDGERVAAIEAVRVPRFVDLLRVPAAPAPVDEVLAALAALELPDGPIEAQPYLQVRVLASGPLPGLRQRVDDALAGKPVRLARIEVVHASAGQAGAALPAAQSLDDLAALEPEEVFRACHRARFLFAVWNAGRNPSASWRKPARRISSRGAERAGQRDRKEEHEARQDEEDVDAQEPGADRLQQGDERDVHGPGLGDDEEIEE